MQKRTGNTPPRKKPARAALPANQLSGLRDVRTPFAGVSKTGAPAKDKAIPHLTAQVELAKARKLRVAQGGILSAEQRAVEQKAAETLAKPSPPARRIPQTRSKPLAGKPLGVPAPGNSNAAPKSGVARIGGQEPIRQEASPRILPLPSSAPFVVPPPSAPAPSSTLPPPGRRGTTNPRAQLQAAQPKQGGLLGQAADYLSGPALGDSGAAKVAHAIDLAAGTSIAALGPSLISDVKHPIAAAEEIKKRGLVTTNEASTQLGARVAKLGATGSIPKGFKIPSIDLVAPAGAAGPKRPITAEEYKRLEAQGFDLSPRLKKRFTEQALKNGYTTAELDGVSGSRRIDMAFSKPAPFPIRQIANTAGDISQLGTVPAGVEGAGRMIASGKGLEVAQKLGEGLYSQLPVVGKHPFVDMVQAHPFQFLTQFAGMGKTTGTLAGLARVGKTAERVVTPAGTALSVGRGLGARNAYDATGQMISDAAARRIPRVGNRLQAQNIDDVVRFRVNEHRSIWQDAQIPYKKALDKVGDKRSAELTAYHMAGGKPEQLAAFYRSQGNKSVAKFYDKAAAATKTLSEKDHEFLAAHSALAAKITESQVTRGRFGPTGAEFRRYSPLIRSSAHLGDPEAQRILALRDEYLKGFDVMPEQDVAALRGAIDHGVQEFATKHKASGGIEPAYVEYTQPKPLIAPPYKPGPGGPTGFKKQRGKQKAETGATFESGQYLIDPNAPLIQSIREQRAQLAEVLHEDVSKAVGQHVTAGDAIPDGHVFVSETNLRGLKKTSNDLADNPVSAPDYDEFASQKQGIFDRLSGAAIHSNESVPKGEKGYVIPIASWKRILDHTRPPSRTAYDRFMNQYQRVLIGYRPSTFVNNAVGSPILASTFGAGPKSYAMAARAGRDPSLAAPYASGAGVAGGLAPSVRSKVGGGLDWARYQSQRAEDFARRATYFHSVLPGSKKRAKELGYDNVDDYLRDVAAGKVDTQRLNKGLDLAADALGDALKPNGKFGRAAGRTILFHNWVAHMAKTLLYTLPVKHPRRLAILNDLAEYGDQYRQEHGVWPDWYAAYLPLFQHVERLGHAGKAQVFTKAFNTGGFNPYATLNNFAAPVSTNESAANILLGLANPVIATAGKTIFARPYDSKSPLRYAAGQVVRQVPGVSVVRPQSGMASDSIPFISEQQKVYSSGHKRNGKTVPLPYDFRPGARPEGGWEGIVARYLFGGVSDIPAQGPVHSIEQKKHIGAVAKAARKH